MAASELDLPWDPTVRRKPVRASSERVALSYSQEIPILEQLLGSISPSSPSTAAHPPSSQSYFRKDLRRSTLGGVEQILSELLQQAMERQQTERVEHIIKLEDRFRSLHRKLTQDDASISADEIEIYRPLDFLPSTSPSSSSESSSASSSSPSSSSSESSSISSFSPASSSSFSPASSSSSSPASSSSSSPASSSSSSQDQIEDNDDDDDDDYLVWDKALISSIASPSPDEEHLALFEKSTLSFDAAPSSSSPAPSSSSSPSKPVLTCGICWEATEHYSHLSDCKEKHVFCNECWRLHFESFISEADVLEGLRCAARGCPAVAAESEIQHLVSHETFQRFLRFSILAVVRKNPATRWCPNVRCSHHVLVEREEELEIQCPACKTKFCHKCSHPPHGQKPCKASLSETEKELAKWARTIGVRKAKRCPGCKELVEKSDGCNHMTCRCSSQWCWLCLETLTESHGISEHFEWGDSLCIGLRFNYADSIREAREEQHGGAAAWKAYRLANNIETPKQRRKRIQEHGYRMVEIPTIFSSDEEVDMGLFG